MAHRGPLVFRLPPATAESGAGRAADGPGGRAGLVLDADAVSLVCDGNVCYRAQTAVVPTAGTAGAAGGDGLFAGLRTRVMPSAFPGPIAGLTKLAVYDQATGTVRTGVFFPWRQPPGAAGVADVLEQTGAEMLEPGSVAGLEPLVRALEWDRSDVDALPTRSTESSSPEHGRLRVNFLGPMVQAGKANPMLASHLFSGFPASSSQWTNTAEQQALGVLRAVYANTPDASISDSDDDDTDSEPDAGAPEPDHEPEAPTERSPGSVEIDVDGDAVPLPGWATARCRRLAALGAPRVPAHNVPDFPSGVTGADLRRALEPDAAGRLARFHAAEGGRVVPQQERNAARRLQYAWRWLCCSPSGADRDWAVLDAPACVECAKPFKGSAPLGFWDCDPACTVQRALCRACALDADAHGGGCPVCHGPPLRPPAGYAPPPPQRGPGLALVFADGDVVRVPSRAVRGCSALARLAKLANGTPVSSELTGLPRGITPDGLRYALDSLDDADATGDPSDIRHLVYHWLGCQFEDGDARARDWVAVNEDACLVCARGFCGFAPLWFWACNAGGCGGDRAVCRACALCAFRSGAGCPLCRSPAVARLGEAVPAKRPRDPDATPPTTRRRLLVGAP